jgi:demethylmenaquinone methyltransferase/2-methoxy-6-polyprenyl-1,4-benzoquinol methylase
MDERRIIESQKAYYQARAGEYDEWFLRKGRYDRGPAHHDEWFGEVAVVEAALRDARPSGAILELACGTGLWTRHLIGGATRVTAVDASPEVIALNRQRVGSPSVEYVVADLFAWTPPALYDFVFFGFWLSHVPSTRFDAFWQLVRGALRPGGRAFFVDSAMSQDGTSKDQATLDHSGVVQRRLNDGREFEVVKVFYAPDDLRARLGEPWRGYVRATREYFIYGCLAPSEGDDHDR